MKIPKLKSKAIKALRQARAKVFGKQKPVNPMVAKVREMAKDLSERGVRANAPYKSHR